MKEINNNGIRVLADMIKAKRPLPVGRIAQRTGLSWKTTDNYIKTLEKRGLIECTHGKRRNYCKVKSNVLKELKK